MATVYGSYISSAFRSRADISTSTSNTQVTISVTGYCQMADYYHDSGENFFRKIVIGSDTPNKYVTASTAYFSGGGTYGVGSSSRTYNRTHAAQSIEVGVAIHNDGVYTGWSTADSYAKTTVTVPAKPSYTVTYNANGGSSTPDSQTKWYGESLTLASAISRSNASATGYKVTYNANGGSCSTSSATAARTTKYTFSKWNTKSDGSGTAYSAGASYTGNAALTLYATWTSSTTTSAVTLPTPTRSGYTFNGWYNGSTKAGNAGASFTPTGNVTLTASWTQNSWTVTYAANGGSSTPASQTKLYGQTLTLRPAISRSNATQTFTVSYSANYSGGSNPSSATATKTTKYAFSSWKATNGTTYAASGSYTANAATTMTAQWTSSASTTSVTLPTTTRTGYTFGGWYKESACTNKVGNGGASYTPTASITLYAKWTINTWAVSYNANGGTGAPASQTKTYNQTLTLSSTRPTRSGYTFLGWSTNAAGTGTAYAPGGSYTANAAATLYAVWVAVQVTSLSAYRSNSAGTRSDSGTYGHLSAGWKAMGTIAGTVAVTATANDASVTSSLSNRSGSKTATADLSNTSVGTFGGSYAQDVAVRVSVTATLTVSYGGSSRSVSATRVATIPKVFRLFDALHGGTGLAIGTIATLASTFEVALQTVFQNIVEVVQSNITRDGTYTEPTNGDHQIRLVDSSRRILSYLSAHKTANSPNNYLRLTAYGPSGSKTANVYISASDTNGYISTDCAWVGGIVSDTSDHVIRDTRFDRDGSNPLGTTYSSGFAIHDKDEELMGRLRVEQYYDGRTGCYMQAFAEGADGAVHGNYIDVLVDKSGNKSYLVNAPAAFRDAIGATGGVWQASALVSTGWTYLEGSSTSSFYVRWAKVAGIVFVEVYGQKAMAAGATVQLATNALPSGSRPSKEAEGFVNVSVNNVAVMWVSTNGTVWARNYGSSATANIYGHASFPAI